MAEPVKDVKAADSKQPTESTKEADKDKSETEKVIEKQSAEKFDKSVKVDAAVVENIQKDSRFAVAGRTITTAEDAYYAFLREEITEEEMRAVVAMNGGSPFYALKANLERPDNAFRRDVPEDLYDDPSIAVTTVDERLEVVEAKQEDADKAQKEADERNKKELSSSKS
ncbi:MAG: hypothetical protein ABWY25_12590 [Paenisporosarcina sp.]